MPIRGLAKAKSNFRNQMWVRQDDGTYFEIAGRDHVSVERFKNFVSELPEGAKIVPKPALAQHTVEEVEKLRIMKEEFDQIMPAAPQNTATRTQFYAIVDSPTLSFAQKGKKTWALRKVWKSNITKLKPKHPDGARTVLEPSDWANINGAEELRARVEKNTAKLGVSNNPKLFPAAEDVKDWLAQNSGTTTLQANECSRLHDLIEDIREELGAYPGHEFINPFVVKHDWLAAFGDSLGEVTADEIRLPYPMCVFEFKVANRPVTVLCTDKATANVGEGVAYMYFVRASNKLWIPLQDNTNELTLILWLQKQVAAICVMLDAKIAESTTVAQPPKLQANRRKEGRLPLYDYHVIDLASRYQKNGGAAPANESGIRQRCHLRRGHWLHAEQRPKVDEQRHQIAQRWEPSAGRWRTWVNWYLAGNPDLGFVDKEYKL